MRKALIVLGIFVIVIGLGNVMAHDQVNNVRGGQPAGIIGGMACLAVVLFLVVAAAGNNKKGGGKKK